MIGSTEWPFNTPEHMPYTCPQEHSCHNWSGAGRARARRRSSERGVSSTSPPCHLANCRTTWTQTATIGTPRRTYWLYHPWRHLLGKNQMLVTLSPYLQKWREIWGKGTQRARNAGTHVSNILSEDDRQERVVPAVELPVQQLKRHVRLNLSTSNHNLSLSLGLSLSLVLSLIHSCSCIHLKNIYVISTFSRTGKIFIHNVYIF
jgi:hypothetical protein